jgi:hypothetical protein
MQEDAEVLGVTVRCFDQPEGQLRLEQCAVIVRRRIGALGQIRYAPSPINDQYTI